MHGSGVSGAPLGGAPSAEADEGRRDRAYLLGATGLTALLAFAFLGDKSLWVDETFTLAAVATWEGLWRELSTRLPHMWLYGPCMHLWLKLGQSEWFVRVPSALCAVATVPLYFILVRRLAGSRVARPAVLILAGNALFIHYAQTARGYALMLLLLTLSVHAFLRALEAPGPRAWAAWVAVATLAVYAQPSALASVVSQFVAVGALEPARRPWRACAAAGLALLALVAPVALLSGRGGAADLAWVDPLSLSHLCRVAWDLAERDVTLLVFLALLGAAGGSAAFGRLSSRAAPAERFGAALLLAWALVPGALALVVSLLVQPVLWARYLLSSVPAALALVGWGFASIGPRRPRLVVAVVLGAAMAKALVGWYRTPLDEWRQVTAYIVSRALPGDAVTFFHFRVGSAYDWYAGRARPGERPPRHVRLAPEPDAAGLPRGAADVPGLLRDHPTVWFVCAHDAAPQSSRLARDALLAAFERSGELRDDVRFRGPVRVRRFVARPRSP